LSRKVWVSAVALVAAAMIGWLAGNMFGSPFAIADGPVNVPSGNTLTQTTISSMVAQAEPAVVTITTTTTSPATPFSPAQQSGELGSGFFITPNGEIVTNDHVVNGAQNIAVQIPGHTQLYNATVVGEDYNLDLALIKVNVPFTVPYLQLANSSSVKVGQWAVAIGNPMGLDQSVTMGIISALGRPITIQNRQYVNLLQTDAAINPGNSGGPLLNLQGQVLGVNTATETGAQGLGFAIPASQVATALPYLQAGKTVPQAWLGVEITDMNPQVASQAGIPSMYGALIAGIVPGGPAASSGLRQGDVITAVDGVSIASSNDLLNTISGKKPGQVVKLTVWSNGATKTISVTLATKPQNVNLNNVP